MSDDPQPAPKTFSVSKSIRKLMIGFSISFFVFVVLYFLIGY